MRINFNKIICINLETINAQQLFSICETYKFGFEELYRRKNEKKVSKYWIAEDGSIVAFIISGFFIIGSDFESVYIEDKEKLKAMKPIKTPKMPKTDAALNNYKAFLSEGYDIRSKSMDSKLNWLENQSIKEKLPVILEVDAILDKISKHSISSITKEEKEFLDNSVI
jgi:hypothetical protein